MCEANAYLCGEDGEREMVMESVDRLTVDGEIIRLVSIHGRQEALRARIRRLALLDHEILLERM